MLLALAGVSSAVMAQQKAVVVEEIDVIEVQDKYQVVTNRFWDNWFFSIGGGASMLFGENDNAGSFGRTATKPIATGSCRLKRKPGHRCSPMMAN